MNGGMFGLGPVQSAYLYLGMAFPTPLVGYVLYSTHDALLTAITYQILCCILTPYVYIRHFSKERELKPYFINEFTNKSKQVQEGLRFFTGSFLIIFMTFLYYYELRFNLLTKARLPISHSGWYLLGVLVVMVVVNSVLDEWLWRVFYLKSMPDTNVQKVIVNIFYASYHGLITYYCMGGVSALLAMSTYLSVAASLAFIRERYGFITTVLTHLGMNFGMMVVLADVSFHLQTHPNDLPVGYTH